MSVEPVSTPEGTDFAVPPTHCHLFSPGATHSDCGVPRSEQAKHGAYMPADVWAAMTFCPWCGLHLCPTCRRGDA